MTESVFTPTGYATQTVRISDSVKFIDSEGKDHLVNVSMEGVPLVAMSSEIANLIEGVRAGIALSGGTVDDSIPFRVAPGVPQEAPSGPVVAPAAPAAPQGEDVRTIPAGEVKFFRLATTETGIPRIKVMTTKFSLRGIVAWKEVVEEAGFDFSKMVMGTQYALPSNIKAIKVRFKTPEDGGRPTPDRVVKFVR